MGLIIKFETFWDIPVNIKWKQKYKLYLILVTLMNYGADSVFRDILKFDVSYTQNKYNL